MLNLGDNSDVDDNEAKLYTVLIVLICITVPAKFRFTSPRLRRRAVRVMSYPCRLGYDTYRTYVRGGGGGGGQQS